MNATEVPEALGVDSQCDKILTRLQENLGQEVSLYDLYLVSGSMAIATRISNLRKRGINITHRGERQKDGSYHSWYKLEAPL